MVVLLAAAEMAKLLLNAVQWQLECDFCENSEHHQSIEDRLALNGILQARCLTLSTLYLQSCAEDRAVRVLLNFCPLRVFCPQWPLCPAWAARLQGHQDLALCCWHRRSRPVRILMGSSCDIGIHWTLQLAWMWVFDASF